MSIFWTEKTDVQEAIYVKHKMRRGTQVSPVEHISRWFHNRSRLESCDLNQVKSDSGQRTLTTNRSDGGGSLIEARISQQSEGVFPLVVVPGLSLGVGLLTHVSITKNSFEPFNNFVRKLIW